MARNNEFDIDDLIHDLKGSIRNHGYLLEIFLEQFNFDKKIDPILINDMKNELEKSTNIWNSIVKTLDLSKKPPKEQ